MALERDVVSSTNDNGKRVVIRLRQRDKEFFASFNGSYKGIVLDRSFTSQLDDAKEHAADFIANCARVFTSLTVEYVTTTTEDVPKE